MRSGRLVFSALSFLLVIVFLFGTVAAVATPSENSYDYSRPGSEYNKTLTSADILERYLDNELSEIESDYLISHGSVKIEYNDAITTAYVTATADGDKLTVRAWPYTYTSSSGALVSWVPSVATLLGSDEPLMPSSESDYYEASFTVTGAEELSAVVTVSFTVSFEVLSEDVNSLINKAYTDAPHLRDEVAAGELEYQEKLADYLQKKAEYEEYLSDKADYEEALRLYEEYLVRYNVYKEACDRYNAYLAELLLYDKALSAYEKYLSDIEKYDADYAVYARYISEKRAYDEKMEAYGDYLELVEKYSYHLDIIGFAKKSMTPLKRTLYSAIRGTTVDLVLRERDTIESSLGGGVPAAVIDLAGDSTERLRELMKDYFALDSDEAKYYYYASYYEDFRDNFSDLLRSLDYLYSNRRVRGILIERGKDEQYRILLAQLYVIVNALSDTPVKSLDPSYLAGSSLAADYKQYVFDSTYRIDTVYKYTVKQVLYGEEYIEDRNSAAPFTASFPQVIEEPEAPKKIDEPTKPAYVAKPPLPEKVDAPGAAPEAVENPGDALTSVENPGEAPTPYVVGDEVRELILAYENGDLTYRNDNASENLVYTVEKTVYKQIGPSVEEITVSFYDTDRTTRLFSTTVDRGTPVSYDFDYVPEKAEDDRARYIFSGWEGADGTPVVLSQIDSDIILYPRFTVEIKEYTVRWIIDGREYVESVPYGDTPVCVYDTEKPSDELYFYTFSNFDKKILPVTEDVSYTAEFSRDYIVPTSEGGGRVELSADGYVVNLYASYDTEYRIDGILEKSKGRYAVILNTRYASIKLSVGAVTKLIDEGVAYLGLGISTTERGTYSYLVSTKDSCGKTVKSATRVEVYLPCLLENNERLGLYYKSEDGIENKAGFTLSDSTLVVSLLPGREYELRYEYKLTLVLSDLLSATLGKNVYSFGESIDLTVNIPLGVKIKSVTLKLDGGEESEVSLSGLTMPMSDATLVIEAERLSYKIVFSGDDAPISTQYCEHGEMPTPPVSPPKASDGNYTYEFVGWSREVEPATRDAVYFAVYRRTPIEKSDTGGRITIFMLLNLAAALAAVVFFLLIPATVVNVKVMKKFKAQIVKNTEKTE